MSKKQALKYLDYAMGSITNIEKIVEDMEDASPSLVKKIEDCKEEINSSMEEVEEIEEASE